MATKTKKPPRVRITKTIETMSSFGTAEEMYGTLIKIMGKHKLSDVTMEVIESYGHSHEIEFRVSRLETDDEYAARLKKAEDAERKLWAALKRKFEPGPGGGVFLVSDTSGVPEKSSSSIDD